MDTPLTVLESILQETTKRETFYFGVAPPSNREGSFFLLCGTSDGLPLPAVNFPCVIVNFYSETPFSLDKLPPFLLSKGETQDSGRNGIIEMLNQWVYNQLGDRQLTGPPQWPTAQTSYLHLWDGQEFSLPKVGREITDINLPRFKVFSAPHEEVRRHLQEAEKNGGVEYSFVSLPLTYIFEPKPMSKFELHGSQGSPQYLSEQLQEAGKLLRVMQSHDERLLGLVREMNHSRYREDF